MTLRSRAQTFVATAALLCLANAAHAGTCTVPSLSDVAIGSNGVCPIALVNGPITFTNVLDPANHNHDVTITSLVVSTSNSNTIVEIKGTNLNLFNNITNAFDLASDNVSIATTDSTGLASFAFGTPDIFNFTQLSVGVDPGFTPNPPAGNLPLNWALKLNPSRTSDGTSTATDNGNGTYTIDSFFDVFFDLSLDNNLGLPNQPPGTPVFTAQDGRLAGAYTFANVPEPMTIALFGVGLAGLARVRRRARGKS